MSFSEKILAGSNDCATIDWYEKIRNNSLTGVVDKISKNGRTIYRINLQDKSITSLFGIATLIDQFSQKGLCNFEMINCSCEEKIWDTFFKQVYDASQRSLNRESIHVDIALNQKNESILKKNEDSLRRFLGKTVELQFVNYQKKEKAESKAKHTEDSVSSYPLGAPKTPSPFSSRGGVDEEMILTFTKNEELEITFSSREANPASSLNRLSQQQSADTLCFGDYQLKPALKGMSINFCEIIASIKLVRDPNTLDEFCAKMKEKGISRIHVKLNAIDENDSALFMLLLLQKNLFSHITFEGSSNGIELIMDTSYEKLEFLDFKSVTGKGEWIKKLPVLFENSPKLSCFSCDIKLKILSLKFLGEILLQCPTLTKLNLPGIQVELDVLSEWLIQERNLQRESELTIVLSKGLISDNEMSLISEMLAVFNAAGKGSVQLQMV